MTNSFGGIAINIRLTASSEKKELREALLTLCSAIGETVMHDAISHEENLLAAVTLAMDRTSKSAAIVLDNRSCVTRWRTLMVASEVLTAAR
ncbi:MAG TPA: hypothetical protein VGU69_09605 [Rhizomicrobium sp.]|nr:hypothetical protein [Rhizomicrobium sp.]